MALSLRKPPKFKRNDYQRLGQRRPWNYSNEFVLQEDETDAASDYLHETDLELSDFPPRNRLHHRPKGDLERTHRTSKNEHQTDTHEFLTYEIKPEDTLQGIALKYGCTIAELKRVNNLIQDQDAFALRNLRIPAREHSILFEIFSQSGSRSSDDPKTIHVSINQMIQSKVDKEPGQFLKEMDKDIQRMVEKAQSQQAEQQATQGYSPPGSPLGKSYDGANWGINWYNLLLVLLFLSVLAPVTYGIYFATMVHSSEKNSNNKTSLSAVTNT